MSKIKSFTSFMKMFLGHIKEDWNEMDHKFIRIVIGGTVFILSALFWLYFFNSTTPFKF